MEEETAIAISAAMTHVLKSGQVVCAVCHDQVIFFCVEARTDTVYEDNDVITSNRSDDGCIQINEVMLFIFYTTLRCCQAFHIRAGRLAERLNQSSLSLAHLFVC